MAKVQILVQRVLPAIFFGSGSKDNGRYAEVLPLSGKAVRPGTTATFIDREGKKLTGVVVDGRPLGIRDSNNQVVQIV